MLGRAFCLTFSSKGGQTFEEMLIEEIKPDITFNFKSHNLSKERENEE